MKILSTVNPIHNEKDTNLEILKRVEDAQVPGLSREIIFVDDCSTDGTRDLLRKEVEPRGCVRVLYHDRGER